ncbi:MAG TPA: tRNA 2-thiouridine(34) synthase MnmA [Anaerolineae bacterium]|nr:tRNA 2-thiouridine(34) synthase MnmA [Anaerolineae bacterium]
MGSAERVVVGMSGGVDSSVAAALLVEQGYEVVGVMLRLWAEPQEEELTSNLCCTPEAVDSARDVAVALGIPFYLVNAEGPFRKHVVEPFIAAYGGGRTPNPCLACNRHIRFGYLLRYAQGLGAGYLATGHYARIGQGAVGDGALRLLRGVDAAKDQSYVLYMLGQDALSHLLFPLGNHTKPKVRQMARSRRLPVADREESQDLCFVGGGDYREFLRRQAPEAASPGPIVDQTGRLLGWHQGLAFHTIGQRKGLGIAASEPLYVLRMDVRHNSLVVGPASALGRAELTAGSVSFISDEWPSEHLVVTARIRYRADSVPAVVWPLGYGRVRVVFDRLLRDITAGQAVVFYDGDTCLGGGIIE